MKTAADFLKGATILKDLQSEEWKTPEAQRRGLAEMIKVAAR
jgi:hypothetical protein